MGDDQRAHALRGDIFQRIGYAAHVQAVQPAGRLIQNEYAGVLGKGAGYDQPLFFPAGEGLRMPLRKLFQREHAEQTRRLFPAASGKRETALDFGPHAFHMQLVVGVLEDHAGLCREFARGEFPAVGEKRAVKRLVQTGEQPGKGGLARAVVADERDDAGIQPEGCPVIQEAAFFPAEAQIFRFEDRRGREGGGRKSRPRIAYPVGPQAAGFAQGGAFFTSISL